MELIQPGSPLPWTGGDENRDDALVRSAQSFPLAVALIAPEEVTRFVSA